MMRWVLLSLSVVFALVASLTVFRAPTLATWMLAILADEYGHYLLLGPLAVLALAGWRAGREGPGFTWLTLLLSLAAVALFLRPTWEALAISRALPATMDKAFGPGSAPAEPPFQLRRYLVGRANSTMTPESRVYRPGLKPLWLDFYRAGGAAVPCVVAIHGGGWDSGTRGELPALYARLARKGYAVAAIDYQLAPGARWPAQEEDVRAALAYLRAHAVSLGIDPHRFVLFGRSAGGQIASASAYAFGDPDIRGVIALYSPHDLPFAWLYGKPDDILNSMQLLRQYCGGSPDEAPASYRSASAIFQVTPKVPPTLLIHGALDTLVWHKQSERLSAELEKAHVPHVFVSLPWATHAFDYTLNGPGGQLAVYAIEGFLDRVTR